jgi:RecA-family ATPase
VTRDREHAKSRRSNGVDHDAALHSIEAEQAVIGALLLDSTAWSQVAEVLHPGDFYRPDHRLIFQAIVTLAASGTPFDTLIVSEQLERSGQLVDAGGLAYLGTLARDTPSAANISVYADAVVERANLRRLDGAGAEMQRAVRDGASSVQIAQALRPALEEFVKQRTGNKRTPLDWSSLSDRTPPEREWAINHWLGMGHVTLLAGAGGAGKTSLGQAMGSCLAVRREYLDWPPAVRRVLMWACEDDEPELWRRQVAIARWLSVPLTDFSQRLELISYDGQQCELVTLVDQRRLAETRMLAELRDQIGDYRAEVVVLDNVARLYGGNENDRHQVTTFIAMLTAAAAPTRAAVLLLGHPGKAQGSEYSGSTAWEGAVRSRLYLGRSLPDADRNGEESPAEDTVRYLCRRKANYSSQDWRRLHFRDGVVVPEIPAEPSGAARPGPDYARDVVARAVRKLAEMGEQGSASSASPKFLPKLARDYKLLENISEKQFAGAMREMRSGGQLHLRVVGQYSNRTPRHGLVLSESP